ncbi:gamma-glutamylcysteine synthetase [Trypanosoma brucei equiperdum]|uniref:Glutamate--cysteine ligase n=1 Tax=Trypanosoma brucei equiperdum TaxID=630700 RepID=A0A3L6KYN2_9TRYP|nr:gamma-glutamylcysteine synthetase [Trypanosoma brucei equiperdum]
MGLLTTGGQPLQWGTEENNRAKEYVSAHGIQQFLWVYNKQKELPDFPFLWGDEIEHQLVRLEGRKVKLSLNAADVIKRLSQSSGESTAEWRPEYGSFMVESLPGKPYSSNVDSLCSVEVNMRRRYHMLDAAAGDNTFAVTLVTFPLMGVGGFTTSTETESPCSQSLFVPDACINDSHPRFKALTNNIRLRRGRKVCIQVPMFIDRYTMERTVDPRVNIDLHPRNVEIVCTFSGEKTGSKGKKFSCDTITPKRVPLENEAVTNMTHLYTPVTHYYYAQYFQNLQAERVKQRYQACPCPVPSVNHPCIYMDCMAFGMGCNCLQLTMQLPNEAQARHIYDQLGILCPLFLALSSATPFQKGILCESDVRWLTITASVDDRKYEEVPHIIKSRYDSISVFVSSLTPNLEEFNDEVLRINDSYYNLLTREGVDSRLATHIAHLFIRDPLVIYDQMIDIDDHTHVDHFENIQSTNWQTVRLKVPVLDSTLGWRVEFRVMDVMPTPFENAAYSVFVVLLTRAIMRFGAVFYTKLSIVDENMGRAHNINPCQQHHIMRRDIFASKVTTDPSENCELTVGEVINGKPGEYYGLIPLVRRYLEEENIQSDVVEGYLNFISKRACGEIPTAAQYLRNFVKKHPDYREDSRLTEQIAHDVVNHVHQLACGGNASESMIGAYKLGSKRQREG